MKAKIYRPARTAMQSGTAKTKHWLLVFESDDRKFIDPVMGWTGSKDTNQQLRLSFPTLTSALEYARSKNITAEVHENQQKAIKPKSYAANFAYNRIRNQ